MTTTPKWRQLGRRSLAAGCLAASGALAALAIPHGTPWPVPEAAKKVANPVKATPQALAAAKKIYVEVCAQCHGDTGKGDGTEAMMYTVKPANFTEKHMMDSMTDGEIFYKITEGRRPMPSFKNSLTEEQRWQLVHFVRTFAKESKKAQPKQTHKH